MDKIKKILRNIRSWYGRFERPISSISLIAGFVFDAVALHRVDTFWENVWLVAHIVIIAICMILVHKKDRPDGAETDPTTIHFWLVNAIQFFFGGLLSTILVFYFRSATLAVSWPFLVILVVTFVANESLKRHFVRLTFQIALFYLSIFLCCIFLVPVIVHQIGVSVFMFSGFVSLAIIAVFLLAIFHANPQTFRQDKKLVVSVVASIYLAIHILYFLNIIPPIPLSLKDTGIYYSIARNADGDYVGTREVTDWKHFFQIYENIHVVNGQPLYIYSAIFSPTKLNVIVVHKWEHFDESNNTWSLVGTVNLSVIGGRDGGFRTYSARSGLLPGKWRVSVQTQQGQTIGRLLFTVVPVQTTPVMQTDVNE